MTAEDIRRNEEVGFITSRRRFCVAEDGAFIQSVGIKKTRPRKPESCETKSRRKPGILPPK